MISIVELQPEHVRQIVESNENEGHYYGMSWRDMVYAYLSPGSIAVTMLAHGSPVACGGIINVGWHRGEAFVLSSSQSWAYRKSMVKEMMRRIPEMAITGGFCRVQATCFSAGREKFFRALGFELEGNLKRFGPNGEDADVYACLFDVPL